MDKASGKDLSLCEKRNFLFILEKIAGKVGGEILCTVS